MLQKVMRYGAPELKATYERNLGKGFVVSATLHLIVAFLLFMNRETHDPSRPAGLLLPPIGSDTLSVPLTLMNVKVGKVGGGGGSRTVEKPEGQAKKGAEDADPKLKTPNRRTTTVAAGAGKVTPVADAKSDNRPRSPNQRDTNTNNVRPGGNPGQHDQGKGVVDAGGSGGPGVGFGRGSGVGNYSADMGGRGWQVRPNAVYPSGSSAVGAVTLSITILPDGKIGTIVPVKSASADLLKAAVAGLRRARAAALPAGAAQSVQKASITFNFKLK